MNEKEKKAYNYLKEISNNKDNVFWCYEAIPNIETVLNLIEKQQKEIEELKKITNSYNSYGGNLMNDTRIIICDSRYFLNGTFVNKFISKDKIREKIEQLEDKVHIVIPNEYNKIEIINEFKNEGAINALQELLEENNGKQM